MFLAALVILGSLAGDGSLHGILVDSQEASISGAQVLVVGSRFRREMRTDERGEFEIRLPVGTYRLEANAPGFKKSVRKRIKVKEGATFSLRIPLAVVQFKFKCPKNVLCL